MDAASRAALLADRGFLISVAHARLPVSFFESGAMLDNWLDVAIQLSLFVGMLRIGFVWHGISF